MARLLQVDRIIGFYQKTEFRGLHFSKNFQTFTAVSRFVLLHFGSTDSTYFEAVGQVETGFLFCTCRSTYIWQLSRMEILFFGRNKLLSIHSCSRCFYLIVSTCFEKYAWCFNAMIYYGDANMPWEWWFAWITYDTDVLLAIRLCILSMLMMMQYKYEMTMF